MFIQQTLPWYVEAPDLKRAAGYVRVVNGRHSRECECQREIIKTFARSREIVISRWMVDLTSVHAPTEEQREFRRICARLRMWGISFLLVAADANLALTPEMRSGLELIAFEHGVVVSSPTHSSLPSYLALLEKKGLEEFRKRSLAREPTKWAVNNSKIGVAAIEYGTTSTGKIVEISSNEHVVDRITLLRKEGVTNKDIVNVFRSEGIVNQSTGRPYSLTAIKSIASRVHPVGKGRRSKYEIQAAGRIV